MTTRTVVKSDMLGEFRRRLRRERGRLMRTVARTDAELAALETHETGDRADAAATNVETAILSRLEGQERHEIDEIDAARARLEAGTFGACERCGQAIAVSRLHAMPTARYCLPCQIHLMP